MRYELKNMYLFIPLNINNLNTFCLVDKANICAIAPRIQEFE